MRLLFLLIPCMIFGQDPDLPTIELTELKACLICHGFGRYATGGRGGAVIKVTNTNSSGAGSLRAALETSGARTIIFEVDGSAEIVTSLLTISNDDYTIAGQTAPGHGFAVYSTNYGIENRASDVIIRHLKFRGSGDNGTTNRSNFRIMNNSASGGNITDVILDHVSMSWPDEDEMNVDVAAKDGFTTSEITVQYSMLYESDRNFLIFQRGHSVSIFKNLMAYSNQRGVRDNYPDLISTSFIGFEQTNNIIHAWNTAPIQPSLGTRFSAVNNIYTLSSTVTPTTSEIIRGQNDGTGTAANTHAYITGNVNESSPGDIIADDGGYDGDLTPYLEASALVATDLTGVNLLAAADLETDLLPYIGSFYWDRDTEDAAAVSNFTARTGSVVYNGTLPTLSSGTYPTDTDDDGMSDAFEDLHGLDKNSATDRNDTKQSWTFSGLCNLENTADYTNLEIYLAYLAKDFELMVNGQEEPDGSWTLTAAVGGGLRITPSTKIGVGAGLGKVIIGN